MLPLEFDTKEVRHLSHKVNTGEGFELALKGNVSVATRAKINKIVNVKCKVALILPSGLPRKMHELFRVG